MQRLRTTPNRVRFLAAFLGIAALACSRVPDGASDSRIDVGDARVEVTVERQVAHVVATYVLPSDSAPRFQYFATPCARIDTLRFSANESLVPVATTFAGPWATVRPTTPLTTAASTVSWDIRYVVTVSASDPVVPVVMPAASLRDETGQRSDETVTLVVRLGTPRDRVILPRVSRGRALGEWRTTMVAAPSFLRLRLAAAAELPECETQLPGDGRTLVWRFWVFVGVLGTWVLLYQWWVRRQSDSTPSETPTS